MDKESIAFISKQIIDFTLSIFAIVIALIWFTQSIIIIVTQNPLAVVRLFPLNTAMHATSALNITIIYFVNYFFFRTFLPGHLRVVRAMLFTVIGAVFYDFVWSTLNITINGYGSIILPLISFVIVFAYIIIFDKKMFRILNVDLIKISLAVIIYSFTLVIFVYSGFFQQFALYEQGLAVDPHGLEWLINKTAALWMWMSIATR